MSRGRDESPIQLLLRHPMELVLLAMYLLLALTAHGFITLDNQLNVLRNVAVTGIIACGMTMVIIAGEIDLSVASVIAASGCLCAWVVQWLTPASALEPAVWMVVAGVVAALGFGLLVGWVSGTLRHRVGVPTFITTLAMMAVLVGFANLITDGTPIESFPNWFGFIGSGRWLGVPVPVYLLALAFVGTHVVSRYTTFGREVYAVGGNLEAARLSGIDVWRVKTLCMMLTSFGAAVGGVIYASLINSGNSTVAKGAELEVISAVIIGGTSLFGGKGTIWGTFIGVMFLGVLLNGMTLWGFNPFWQDVVRGGLILLAVLLNQLIDRKR
ncbi:MAG: ABC transporter permease [Burkholderiales bacterium]|nr:ABC transporter permease [Burkholderiales bacterium]MDE2457408.1 ABC transporter permease [Burkholderiales bacterium]